MSSRVEKTCDLVEVAVTGVGYRTIFKDPHRLLVIDAEGRAFSIIMTRVASQDVVMCDSCGQQIPHSDILTFRNEGGDEDSLPGCCTDCAERDCM
jgi:hypothetical protein